MKKLIVRYRGWGESWPLGQLAHDGKEILFEYSNEALLAGFEPSPIRMPVRQEAYGELPSCLDQLPGFIADSLPDGWGLRLMDRHFRRAGIELATTSPLDRLAFLGDRGMGALTFEPAASLELTQKDTTLLKLAREVGTVLSGEDGEVLNHLLLMGGSPHGAQPKVLVNYDPAQGTISTSPALNHRPYLIKFPAQNEHREVCAIERAYCETARACGFDIPTTHHFDLGRTHAAFGIARFDIEDDLRVPVHTLAGALHADFRVPSVDYITLLRATRAFTRDESEVVKAYERAVFNVLFNNRDDHCKNFAFRLDRDRQWRLAPGYDITFNAGPGGEHQMDVCGEARRITRAHMARLAEKGGIKERVAAASLDRVLVEVAPFEKRLRAQPIRATTIRKIIGHVRDNQAALRR